MTMEINGEDYEITPAVWDVFDAWYGDKAYRKAGFVADIEAAVRAQVAKEMGDTLTVDGVPRRVMQTDLWDRGEELDSYFVWVERGPDGEPREG